MQPSSTSQIIALSLLRHWGISGFLTHAEQVAAFYLEKREMFERALRKHMVGLAEWTIPNSGMFFWSVVTTSVICYSDI
jgi:DNA-binding transcriptional MocR family regulator